MVADPKPERPKPSRIPHLPTELLGECQFHLAAVGSGGNVWFWKHSMLVFPKHFPGIFFLKKFFLKKWICSNLKLSQIKKKNINLWTVKPAIQPALLLWHTGFFQTLWCHHSLIPILPFSWVFLFHSTTPLPHSYCSWSFILGSFLFS